MCTLNQTPSARIYVLISPSSQQAIILRTGPSERVLTMGWNLKNNQFTTGQWLKGKIYIQKCDISPNGQNWVYFAYKKHPYTVIARTPYLKATHYFENDSTYGGGGYFHNDKDISLSTCATEILKINKSLLNINRKTFAYDPMRGISFFAAYMAKNNWICTEQKPWDEGSQFQKTIDRDWQLTVKSLECGHERKDGGQKEFLYTLQHIKSEMTIESSDWDWADYYFNKNSLIWAEFGKIMTGQLHYSKDNAKLINVTCLLDMNNMPFEELIAPY